MITILPNPEQNLIEIKGLIHHNYVKTRTLYGEYEPSISERTGFLPLNFDRDQT